MRNIFDKLDVSTTPEPDPSCTVKLANKAKYCAQLATMQLNTASREADVETARTNRNTARTDRNTARIERNTARDEALNLNQSIAPVAVTAEKIKKIKAQTNSHKALKSYQASFNPAINHKCLDALNTVISKTDALAKKEEALTKADEALYEAQRLLEKNTKNINDKTEAIANLDASMVGLNCNAPDCTPNTLTGNKRKSKKRRTT